MIELHFGLKLVDVKVTKEISGYKRHAYFIDTKTGQEIRMDFGSLLLTPENQKRELYLNNDIADEHVKTLFNSFF